MISYSIKALFGTPTPSRTSTHNVGSVAQSQTPVVTASAISQPEKTTFKKHIKLTSVKTKSKRKKQAK